MPRRGRRRASVAPRKQRATWVPRASGRVLDGAHGPPIAWDRVQEVISVNLVGTFTVVRHAAAAMARREVRTGPKV